MNDAKPSPDPNIWEFPDNYFDPAISKWPESGKLCILDVEYTAWEGSQKRNWRQPWEHREIFQIGAVLIDIDKQFQEVGCFDKLVIPTLNPVLSDYSVQLSGVTNDDLNQTGLSFEEAINQFYEFVGTDTPIFVNGYDGAVIRENCWFNDLQYKPSSNQIFDIRPAIANILEIDLAETISSELPSLLQIETNAMKHNGLCDARAIALALKKLSVQNRLKFN